MSKSTEIDKASYRRLKKARNAAEGTVYVALVLLILYWLMTAGGPVKWLAELQLLIFKDWASLKLAALLAFCIVLYPAYYILEKLLAPLDRRLEALDKSIRAGGDLPPSMIPTRTEMRGTASTLTKWSLVAFFSGLILGIGGIASSLYLKDEFTNDRAAREPQLLDLDTVNGTHIPARFVSINGVAIPAAAETWVDTTSKTRYHATPIFSATWQPGNPIQYFVIHSEKDGAASRKPAYAASINVNGEVIQNGLPETVKSALTQKQVRMTSPHYVIRSGPVQTDDRILALFIISVVGGGILTLGGLTTFVMSLVMKRRYR